MPSIHLFSRYIKHGTFFFDTKSGSYNNAYMFQEIQRINKQMTTKPIVDYFQRVCDADLMHETLTFCDPWFIHIGRWKHESGTFHVLGW